jgi:hypothetical protein
MNRIRRSLARGASPSGTVSRTQASPKPSDLARPAGQATIAPPHGSARIWQRQRAWRPGTGSPRATTNRRLRAIITPRLVPHTIQLCIHCRANPAGFWVSHTTAQTVRRPWCLSCCQHLDPRCYHINPFDS